MSYEPTTWKKGDKVTSTKLNKIEQGIQGNDSEINNLKEDLNEKVNTVNGIAPDENGNIQIETGSGLSQSVKMAILKCFANTVYKDTIGSESFKNLQTLLIGNIEPNVWLYRFNGNLKSDGFKDFNLKGTGAYDTGVNGQAYYREASTQAIYATEISNTPVLNGDFTISFWGKKTGTNGYFLMNQKCLNTSYSACQWDSSFTITAYQNWKLEHWGASKRYSGNCIFWENQKLYLRFHDLDVVYGRVICVTPPQDFDVTAWHHYAFVRNNTTITLFVDGVAIITVDNFNKSLYVPDQIGLGQGFIESTVNSADRNNNNYSVYLDDFYINDKECLFKSSFNPNNIDYGI